METVKEYNKVFSEATKKLKELMKNFYESDILEIALSLDLSASTVRSYGKGDGKNLETTVTLIEAVEKRNQKNERN